jgi:hypothetical protein
MRIAITSTDRHGLESLCDSVRKLGGTATPVKEDRQTSDLNLNPELAHILIYTAVIIVEEVAKEPVQKLTRNVMDIVRNWANTERASKQPDDVPSTINVPGKEPVVIDSNVDPQEMDSRIDIISS